MPRPSISSTIASPALCTHRFIVLASYMRLFPLAIAVK
jgi:hypothetical protein